MPLPAQPEWTAGPLEIHRDVALDARDRASPGVVVRHPMTPFVRHLAAGDDTPANLQACAVE